MKTLFRSSLASPRWSWLAKALSACAVTAAALHTPHAAAEGGQACFATGIQKVSGWTTMTDFAGIANGVTVAEVVFGQTVTATVGNGYSSLLGYTAQNSVLASGFTGPYQTLPLKTFPGLGLRWKYDGYESVDSAPADTSGSPAVGTVITGTQPYWVKAKFTTAGTSKMYRFRWKFELVVTNVAVYAGGVGDFSREDGLNALQVLPVVSDIYPTIINRACSPTLSGFAQAFMAGGAIELPTLPKPPTPTCQFPLATLNQTVNLNSGATGAVPANGAPRTEGSFGEKSFNILANNCGVNSQYSVYFTDINEPTGPKNYLKSTGPLAGMVNLRIYYDGNNSPVQFGPPPVGGSAPVQPAAFLNSNTAANSSFTHPFTVQYVRAPGYSGALNATSLSANATVTVVYP